MQVIIIVLLVPDLAEVMQQGLRHPLLGRLFDGGSYTQIHDLPAGKAGIQSLFASATQISIDAGVAFYTLDAFDTRPKENEGIQLLRQTIDLHEAAQHEQNWYQEVSNGTVLSLIIVDEKAQHFSLALLYSYQLPCMGPITPCNGEDVWHTWLRIGGAKAVPSGRFLLEELESPGDERAEADLTERLRLLYGE